MGEYECLLVVGMCVGVVISVPIVRMINACNGVNDYNPNRREEEFICIVGMLLNWLTIIIYLCVIVFRNFKQPKGK